MSTYRLPILGHATIPDPSTIVYPEPLSVQATNKVWSGLCFVFADGARNGLHGFFAVPQNYSSGANVVIVWSTWDTSGDVEWDFDYRAVTGNDSESLDQAGTQESVNAADTTPGAAWRRLELTIALTDGNFAAGDTVEFGLFRDGLDAGDTANASAWLFGLFFEYDD